MLNTNTAAEYFAYIRAIELVAANDVIAAQDSASRRIAEACRTPGFNAVALAEQIERIQYQMKTYITDRNNLRDRAIAAYTASVPEELS
ncbi:MAG: hypothetical protein WC654_07990 [Patescibacteria group bacterium]